MWYRSSLLAPPFQVLWKARQEALLPYAFASKRFAQGEGFGFFSHKRVSSGEGKSLVRRRNSWLGGGGEQRKFQWDFSESMGLFPCNYVIEALSARLGGQARGPLKSEGDAGSSPPPPKLSRKTPADPGKETAFPFSELLLDCLQRWCFLKTDNLSG